MMLEIRILTNNDLNQYITLLSNHSHTYSWDKLYLQHVSHNYLKQILSKEEVYCNIFGAFKDGELVVGVTLRQLNQIGTRHKAMLENLFLKNKKDEITVQNLICEVINYAQSRHIEKLMTCIPSNHIGTKIFFTAFGFETLGIEKNSFKIDDTYFDVHWLLYDIK